jgi:hypothetical protein
MSELPPERLPTQEDLGREARRLARLRALSLVAEAPPPPEIDKRFVLAREVDPDPKEAA